MNTAPETYVAEMTLGVTIWIWGCGPCLDARTAADWAVKRKDVIAFGCDDCSRRAQAAPGYVTPTVDFVPTSPKAFAPAPGWKPDKPMAPWAKPAAARKQRTTEQETAT